MRWPQHAFASLLNVCTRVWNSRLHGEAFGVRALPGLPPCRRFGRARSAGAWAADLQRGVVGYKQATDGLTPVAFRRVWPSAS
jgi:hypothetical protein